MKDDVLKSRLSRALKESTEDIMTDTQVDNNSSTLDVSATNVMASYQNANKWLDIIKEYLLMNCGCVFFSNYIHNLAHSMPVRFDKFGDILHTIDMKVPYPATAYIDSEPSSVEESFDKVCTILDNISSALVEFIGVSESNNYKAMSVSAEALLEDISNEYTNLKRMRRVLNQCEGDIVKFDKWVAQYLNNLGTLID